MFGLKKSGLKSEDIQSAEPTTSALADDVSQSEVKHNGPNTSCWLVLQYSVVHSHWSRFNKARLSLVESFIVLLCQHSYAIKNQLIASKAPYSSLVLYGIRIVGFHARKGPIIDCQ